MRNRAAATLIALAALATTTSLAGAANPWEQASLAGPGLGGPVVGTAAINRGDNGLTAKVTMTIPAAEDYDIPPAETWPTSSGVHGDLEAFSLWVFLFFNPEACAVPFSCGPADLVGNEAVIAGAFNAGGHLAAQSQLTIAGRVDEQDMVFPPTAPLAETLSEALDMGYSIADAEIHVAVAPHGARDPHLLPAQITTPAGNPSFWWLAFFDPQS